MKLLSLILILFYSPVFGEAKKLVWIPPDTVKADSGNQSPGAVLPMFYSPSSSDAAKNRLDMSGGYRITHESGIFFQSNIEPAFSDIAGRVPGARNSSNWSDLQHRSAGFIGLSHYGGKFVLNVAESPFYGNLFFGGMINPSRRVANARDMFMAGISAGYTFSLDFLRPGGRVPGQPVVVLGENANRVQFYAGIGPGFGISMMNIIDDDESTSSSSTHFGVHAETFVGALKPFTRAGSVFVEMGTLVIWYPGFREMQFVGGPSLSVGFQFMN